MRILSGLLLAAVASAQTPSPFGLFRPNPRANDAKALNVLPEMDIEQEIAKAEQERGMTKMLIFGKINPVSVDFFSVAQPEWLDNGILFTAGWRVENAYSLAIHFDKFDVPQGGALFVVGNDKVIGAFTHETKWFEGNLMTQHLDGNQVTVQYFQHRDTKGKATIHVDVVTSSFRDVDSLNAGLCNIQAACANTQDACNPSCTPTNRLCSIWCTHIRQNPAEGQWADRVWFERQQRAATVMVSAAGSRFCSGSFIDNVNRAPLLLTAAHCGTGATTLIQQFWRSPICASIENFDGTFEQRGNIRVVAQRTESDVTLLEVGDPTLPANTFLSGWDATNDPTVIANVVAVHHPARSNMKLAHGGAVILSRWSGSGDPTHWRINAWTEATTEGGSSGSPMYHRQTRRIIGQLHGGSAACPALNGWDAYGGIFRSFLEPNFRQALTGGTTRLFMDGQFLRGFGNSTQ